VIALSFHTTLPTPHWGASAATSHSYSATSHQRSTLDHSVIGLVDLRYGVDLATCRVGGCARTTARSEYGREAEEEAAIVNRLRNTVYVCDERSTDHQEGCNHTLSVLTHYVRTRQSLDVCKPIRLVVCVDDTAAFLRSLHSLHWAARLVGSGCWCACVPRVCVCVCVCVCT
jgi:hypothetical protein